MAAAFFWSASQSENGESVEIWLIFFKFIQCSSHQIWQWTLAGWWFFATPLKNMMNRQLGWWQQPNISGKIKNVPNHQPDEIMMGYLVGILSSKPPTSYHQPARFNLFPSGWIWTIDHPAVGNPSGHLGEGGCSSPRGNVETCGRLRVCSRMFSSGKGKGWTKLVGCTFCLCCSCYPKYIIMADILIISNNDY